MMKKLLLIAFLFCAFSVKAQQNLVLNGSFEFYDPIIDSIFGLDCYNAFGYNSEYNNALIHSNSFGDDNTTGIVTLPCLVCIPSFLWGGDAVDGNNVLLLDGVDESVILPWDPDTFHIIKQGKVSLKLQNPLSDIKRYKLSFYAKSPPTNSPTLFCITKKGNFVTIGISHYNNQFETQLLTIPLADTAWSKYNYVFETQNSEEYITIEVGLNDTINQTILLDHFVLTETTEPLTTGINELSGMNKQLLKIVDILGKESKSKKGLLFYIYRDGTVEKRLVIE